MATGRTITAAATLHVQDEDEDAGPGTAQELEIDPTEITYKSERFDSAAQLEIKGLPHADRETVSQYPEASGRPVGLTCEINGTLIGSGELQNGTVDGDGVWEGAAYDGVRRLRKETITKSYQGATVVEIIRDIFEEAGIRRVEALFSEVDGLPTYREQFPQAIADLEEIPAGAGDPQVEDLQAYLTSKEFTSVPCFEALSEVLQDVNWHWWARPTNTIIIDDDLPSERHEVPYVLETSAGKQLPPYQRVEVTGGRGTVESAPANMATTTGGYIVGKAGPIKESAGSGEPVFEYTDRSISDRMTARRTARGILQEFQRQQAGGNVKIVGNAEIRALDGITLPDHLGGETYLVAAVTHEVSGDNGFTTDITCAGLLDATEWEGDVDEILGSDGDEDGDDFELDF